MKIIYKGGIHLKFDNIRIALDPEKDRHSNFAFISHAHFDHSPSVDTVTPKICSEATRELVKHRRNLELINTITKNSFVFGNLNVRQYNSGHIIGSTSLLVKADKKKIFYTGDICNKHRFHLEAAKIPKADILIIESTYGHPSYVLPPIHEVVEQARKWISEMLENNSVILMGYALGKAQILTKMVEDFDCPIIVHDSIHKINEICKKFGFDYNRVIPLSEAKAELTKKFIGIFPSSSSNIATIDDIRRKTHVKTATFSGWAINPEYKYRLGVDEAFVLSDHCDFNGLLQIVKESGAEEVYTTHGFADELAYEIRNRLGIEAKSILNDQNTIREFID